MEGVRPLDFARINKGLILIGPNEGSEETQLLKKRPIQKRAPKTIIL